MIWGNSWILIVIVAVVVDFIIGELPGKHPVEYLGDYIKSFEKKFYKDSEFRGFILVALLVFAVALSAALIQTIVLILPVMLASLILGVLASTGLASKTLKTYVKNVIFADDDKKRANLSLLVSRNTDLLDDRKVYSSVIESHAENLSDGVIAPLFYLVFFGLPGIMVYKTISTLDSMIGYNDEKYGNYGKVAAMVDDILNYIPARLTAFMIQILSTEKVSWKKLSEQAKLYSSSPNSGYPVAAAAYSLGVKLGGPVYYGDKLINKGEIGEEKTDDYRDASLRFLKIHSNIEIMIASVLVLYLLLTRFIRGL